MKQEKPDPAKDPEYQKYLLEQRNAAMRNKQQYQAAVFGPSDPELKIEAKPPVRSESRDGAKNRGCIIVFIRY